MIYVATGLIFLAVIAIYSFGSLADLGRNVKDDINRKADKFSLDRDLVMAIVKVESNFNPRAKNPADPSYGLMQITPMLAQDYGYVQNWREPTYEEIQSLYDVSNNLEIGCSFLSRLLSKYTLDEAIQMYNVGEYGYVFLGRRNSDYLQKVRKAYAEYH